MEEITRVFKTRIYPTSEQEQYFKQCFGIRRYLWNRALEHWKETNESSNYTLDKICNNEWYDKNDESSNFIKDTSPLLRKEVFKDFKECIDRYYKTKTDDKPFKGYPKFKSKKKDNQPSFRYHLDKTYTNKIISKHHFKLRLPQHVAKKHFGKCNIPFSLRTRESLEFLKNTKIVLLSIKYIAGKYYLLLTYKRTNYKRNRTSNKSIGIDMGLKTSLHCYDSDGKEIIYKIPSSLYKQEKKTERLHKILDRKTYGSNRWKKAQLRLQKSYQREANIMKNFRCKIAKELCTHYKTINIETYNTVSNLKKINRSKLRFGLYDFKMRLLSKSEIYNNDINYIPQFTPTTQTCSCCGNRLTGKNRLTLKDRTYKCIECGNEIDRDLNAAINILNYQP